jgi:hypothetical protein
VGHLVKNRSRSHQKNRQHRNRNLGGAEGRDQRPDRAKIRLGRRLFAARPKNLNPAEAMKLIVLRR